MGSDSDLWQHSTLGMMDSAAVLHLVAGSANIRRVGALERRVGALAVCGLHRQQNGQLPAARVCDGRMRCGRGWWWSLRALRDRHGTVPQSWWRGRCEELGSREDGAICSWSADMQNGIVTFACARYECRRCCHRSESLPKTLYRPPPRILGPAALILGLLSHVKIFYRTT